MFCEVIEDASAAEIAAFDNAEICNVIEAKPYILN